MQLTDTQIRAIGAMIEKSHTTPEYYPLTLNALTTACNQKSNREPVVSYDEATVSRALDDLRDKSLVFRVHASDSRVVRFRQGFTESLALTRPEEALICVLMLRGPQTTGELRGRTSRMHPFDSLGEVEQVLGALIDRALVKKLPRPAGRKATPYTHLFGKPTQESRTVSPDDGPRAPAPLTHGESARVRMQTASESEPAAAVAQPAHFDVDTDPEPDTGPPQPADPAGTDEQQQPTEMSAQVASLRVEVDELRRQLHALRAAFEAYRDR